MKKSLDLKVCHILNIGETQATEMIEKLSMSEDLKKAKSGIHHQSQIFTSMAYGQQR